jgi:hypothetical protein
MKHLEMVALCLASMLVMGMALAGNASAAPLWLVCLEGTGLTKFSTNQCTEASSTGKWQSLGIPSGVAVTVRLLAFSLRLEDTGVSSQVECPDAGAPGSGVGLIEGTNKGKITKFELKEPEKEGCKVLKGILTCKAGTLEKKGAVGLPWTTEIFETESKTLAKVGSSGNPGWSITCGGTTDTCEAKSGESVLEFNNQVSGAVLLAFLKWLENGIRWKCSLGGTGAGILRGFLGLLGWLGWGVSI